MKTISEQSTVVIQYVVKVDDKIVDKSGEEPFQFMMGKSQVIQGLEQGIVGMHVGEKKTLFISPDMAYGKQQQELIKTMDKEVIKNPEETVEGASVTVQTSSGTPYTGKILEVLPHKLVIDFNHPLAGKTLEFELTVLAIQ